MKKPIHWKRLILLCVAAALLLWLGLIARAVLILRADVVALQDYAASLPSPLTPAEIDLAVVAPRVTSIHQNLSALRSIASPLLAITPALGWLPDIGGDVKAAPALLDMALEFTDLGDQALRMIEPFWPPAESDGHLSLPLVTRLLQVLQPAIGSLRANVDRAHAIRQTIETAALSPRTRSILERFDAAYPLASTAFNFASFAPQLLGADQPRTYLIILQNEDELRPTGGFISAAGRVTLKAGEIVTLTVEDAYQVDDFTKPYGDPPAPLWEVMGSQMWLFRDVNWSPDFPATARKAIELYTYTQGGAIDGVIALNQSVVEALVAGLGPLTIDGTPLTAQTIRAYMRGAWAPNGQTDLGVWVFQRKGFIGRLMQAILERAFNQTNQIDWGELARGLQAVLRSHDLLITFVDPVLNRPLHEAGWDGALPDAPGDFLMIVDANLGFNKANTLVREAITYTVALNADGSATGDLALGYTHFGAAANGCPHIVTQYTLTTTYDLLAQQCYWDYRRVIVPAGTTLIDATRHPTKPGELITGQLSDGATGTAGEADKTIFNTLLIVGRGQTLDSRLHYTLPDRVVKRTGDRSVYQLHIQKQPGTGHWPLTIDVEWPAGQRLIDAQPSPTAIDGSRAVYQLTFDADYDLTLTFSVAP